MSALCSRLTWKTLVFTFFLQSRNHKDADVQHTALAGDWARQLTSLLPQPVFWGLDVDGNRKLFSYMCREGPEVVFRYQVTVAALQDVCLQGLLQGLLRLQGCSCVFAKELHY